MQYASLYNACFWEDVPGRGERKPRDHVHLTLSQQCVSLPQFCPPRPHGAWRVAGALIPTWPALQRTLHFCGLPAPKRNSATRTAVGRSVAASTTHPIHETNGPRPRKVQRCPGTCPDGAKRHRNIHRGNIAPALQISGVGASTTRRIHEKQTVPDPERSCSALGRAPAAPSVTARSFGTTCLAGF